MPVCGQASSIWGVAIDGIPIYGPWDETGTQLTRSDLDECGGKTDSKGRYKYHMTVDPDYSISCLRGEIRSDVGKSDKDFMCTCPYYDEPFKTRPPSFSKEARICDFNKTDTSQPISCKEDIDEIKKRYDIGYEWVYKDKEIKLAPCCPKGQDCGDSCQDENGVKSICVQEKRTVKYLTRVKKSAALSNSPQFLLIWITVIFSVKVFW